MARIINRTKRCLKVASVVLAHPSVLKRRYYIFLLSHMRSYSTLLTHILGSHPQISGYSEPRKGRGSYRTNLDLLKLRALVSYHGNYKPDCSFFLDKLLHEEADISDSILRRRTAHVIFFVREPAGTLRSIVAMHRKYVQEGSPRGASAIPATAEDAFVYYRARLRSLIQTAERFHRFSRPALAICADELINSAPILFRRIESFLQLRTPLQERYSVFERTGGWDYGDTSEFIRKGTIERNRPNHGEIIVPPQLLHEAHLEFDRCMGVLERFFPAANHPVGSV
jgi:hypothetical protein